MSRGAEGTERWVSLGDLERAAADLRYCCNRCGRSVPEAIADAIARFGRDAKVPALSPRLRCTRCGARDCIAMPDYHNSPDETRRRV